MKLRSILCNTMIMAIASLCLWSNVVLADTLQEKIIQEPVISADHTLLPDYVTKSGSTYTLFNPEKARFLLGVAQDVYDKDNYDTTLKKYGFTSVQFIERGINTQTGEGETAWYNSMTANFGIKKIEANDGTRYVIAIGIQGTSEGSLADILTDANILKKDGNHLGFYNNASALVDAGSNISFNIDGGSITLNEVIEETKKSDSKYSLLITGHSMGAATADVYAGYFLKQKGVLQKNFEVYTYAAPLNCSVDKKNYYTYNNIFNILNKDDPVVHMAAAQARYGGDIFYTPTEEQRRSCYGNRYKAGEDYNYYAAGVSPNNWQPHDNKKTYPVVLESIISNIDNYIPNNRITFSGGTEYSLDAIKDLELNNITLGNLSTYENSYINVLGELNITNSCSFYGKINGKVNFLSNLNIYGNAEFYGDINIGGNVTLHKGKITINKVMDVGGSYEYYWRDTDTDTRETIINDGAILNVLKNFSQYSNDAYAVSNLYVDGSLIIGESYYCTSSRFCNLYMNGENSYMEVKGNFDFENSGKENNFKNGTIVVGGGYVNNSQTNGTIIKLMGTYTGSTGSSNAKNCFYTYNKISVSGGLGYIYINKNNELIIPKDTVVTVTGSMTIYELCENNGDITIINKDNTSGYLYIYGTLDNNGTVKTAGYLGIYGNINNNGEMNIGGDVTLYKGKVTINKVMNVGGSYIYYGRNTDTDTRETIINDGAKLNVQKNFNHYSNDVYALSHLYVNGLLIIGESYYCPSSRFCNLYMNGENSYMEVKGNFDFENSGKENNFKNGTIVVGGSYDNDSQTNGTIIKLTGTYTGSTGSSDAKNCFFAYDKISVSGGLGYIYINKNNELIIPKDTVISVDDSMRIYALCENDGEIIINNFEYLYIHNTLNNNGTIKVTKDLNIYGDINNNGEINVGGDVLLYKGKVTINKVINVGGSYKYYGSNTDTDARETVINDGAILNVQKSFSQNSNDVYALSNLYVNGSLIIEESYYCSSSKFCNLYMNNENSYMEIGTDFSHFVGGKDNNFTKGKIVVNGSYNNSSKLNGTILILKNGYKLGSINYALGDVNKDKKVDKKDASIVLNHITGIESIDDTISLALANINNDNTVDMIDVVEIMKKAA